MVLDRETALPVPAASSSPPHTDLAPKCWRCERTLAEYLTRPWSLKCKRCQAPNKRGELPGEVAA